MNLFKNKVGRPSNDTLRKRKIFKYGILCFVFSLILFVLILFYGNVNNKAGLLSGPIVTYSDNILGSKSNANSNIKVRAKFISLSKKTYYYDIVNVQTNAKLNINQRYCNAIPSDKKVDFSFTLRTDKTQYKINIYQDSNCTNKVSEYKTRKYYIDNESKLNLNYKNETTKKTVSLNCPTSAKINEEFKCITNQTGVVITLGGANSLASGYSSKFTTTLINKIKTIKYKDVLFNNYESIIKEDANGQYIYAQITASKSGYASVTKKVKIYRSSPSGNYSNNSIKMSRFVSEWSIGGSGTSTVTLNPSNATFSVTSSNPKVMRVNKVNNTQYKIFAVAPGSATITATSSKGSKVSYTYKVKPYEYPNSSRVQNGIKTTTTQNGVKVFVENGCSNTIINRYLKDINELPSYATKPTKAVYFLTEKTFNKINPNNKNHVGQAMLGALYLDVMCNKYHELVLVHEFAHNMDYYNHHFTGNGYISNQINYSNLFNKYKGKILRSYSFTNRQEFFADSYSYYFHKYLAKTNTVAKGIGKSWKYNNEVKKEIENTINTIKELNW